MNDKLLVIKLFEEICDNDENSRRFKRDLIPISGAEFIKTLFHIL